jgi:hypothetical protein
MPVERAFIMHPKDNVSTTVEEIHPGDRVQTPQGGEANTVPAIEAVPFGFNIALSQS